ncbi:hypothetical protein Fleli_1123 [Bernardetia litoralis DSM 6794]|uniref:Nucleotidyltransferase n=1 Tax=Bernardetia litoralis (strain ATCC 23117 / DSM 6794 / NBRC 15988 / NCIMB 1366 / Fx l1 / Sio-4) TaxID=880071 RepID=I4AHX6_BERLS|nr:hypothetical protein [Bernardetia litoralis]AFM03561.1 hypothetical protein Fleli_1123 [Bernardetia litoralis DSM 6794]
MSKLLYNALQVPSLREVINDLREVCEKLEIDFFGIGALARNVWYLDNEKEARGTRDVDFAVYVKDEESYQNLKQELIKNYKYVQSTSSSYCLVSPHNAELDLLPFGEIENDDRVQIEGKGLTILNLDGFLETYQLGISEFEIENEKLKVCSLPAIILLKLISFDDRPEVRIKDAKDINSILCHYPTMETDLIWENYNFLYDNEKSHHQVGTETLGYELTKISIKNDKLTKRIVNILDKAISKQSRLAINMIENSMKETEQEKITLLTYLKEGVEAGIKKYKVK